jgi:hypothetical protein
MADNTTLNPGTGGDVISTDDLGAVKVQRVKVQIGVDGAAADVNVGNAMPVRTVASTSSVNAVSTSGTSATLASASSGRLRIVIVNDSSAVLFVKYGATASSADWTVKLAPDSTLDEDAYTGRIDAVLSTGTGTARVTELSA